MQNNLILGNPLLDALLIIFLIVLPGIIGKIINGGIKIYYINHRYNVQSEKYTAKDLVDKYIYDNNMNVVVRLTKGVLSDYYEPGSDYIYLSESVYQNRSLLSISIAFHELGHAVAFKDGDVSHKLSIVLAPFIEWFARISILGIFILSIGVFNYPIVWILTSLCIILYLITSWVIIKREWIASKFALKMLEKMQICDEDYKRCKVLLRYCWLTYVFHLISIISITCLLTLCGGFENKRKK